MSGTARWAAPKRPGDLTGVRGAQLVREHQAQQRREEAARRATEAAGLELTPDQRVAEVQAQHPNARAYWDDEIHDVVVSYS